MIEMVFGVPRCGKTMLATRWALAEMERGKRKVFTNYPVRHPKLGFTYKWTRDMIYSVLTDAFIVIDEAYRDYDYRNKTGFTVDEDFFFGTAGQNGIDIVCIAHSPIRVDPKIRDRAEVYHKITKHTVPILSFITERLLDKELILYFDDEMYTLEQDIGDSEKAYNKVQYLFKRYVAKAYDTQYFRNKTQNGAVYEKWSLEHAIPKLQNVNINNKAI